jgi:hypothetical protein
MTGYRILRQVCMLIHVLLHIKYSTLPLLITTHTTLQWKTVQVNITFCFLKKSTAFLQRNNQRTDLWPLCITWDLTNLLPWYESLLTRLYFQELHSTLINTSTMSEVMLVAVPLKSKWHRPQVLFQSYNSVPCFATDSKLLWSMLYFRWRFFH